MEIFFSTCITSKKKFLIGKVPRKKKRGGGGLALFFAYAFNEKEKPFLNHYDNYEYKLKFLVFIFIS